MSKLGQFYFFSLAVFCWINTRPGTIAIFVSAFKYIKRQDRVVEDPSIFFPSDELNSLASHDLETKRRATGYDNRMQAHVRRDIRYMTSRFMCNYYIILNCTILVTDHMHVFIYYSNDLQVNFQ